MTEWEKIYECLAELEEEYGFLLREQENCQTVTEIFLNPTNKLKTMEKECLYGRKKLS